jgi:type IV pilus assembly protein PilQ
MILRKSHLLFLIVLAVLTFSVSNVQSKTESEITGIDVREVNGTTEIEIISTTPLTYTMYTSDPYRIVLEMQNTEVKINKKVFDKAGVMEVVPSSVEGVQDAAKLEISLTDPVDVKPVQRGTSLLLTFDTPARSAEAEGEKASGEAQASGKVIENIALSKSGDKLLVTLSGNAEMMAKVLNADNNKLVIDIPDFTTAVESPRVSEPPLQGIRIGKHTDKTRLVFDLTGPAVYNISPAGSQVVISFSMTGVAAPTAVAQAAEAPVDAAEKHEAQATASSCVLPEEEGRYIGAPINLDMQDADLVHIFRLIADVSGCNVVVNPKVSGKFTMRLIDVPWDQALDMILKNYDLDKRIVGNIIRIAKRKDFIDEDKDIAALIASKEEAGVLVSKAYRINYAEVSKVRGIIESHIKKESAKVRGNVIEDVRTGTLIINDVEQNHAKFQELIKTLDKPTPQVNIDARIVEVNKDFTNEFGIQWGVDIRPSVDTAIGGLSTTGRGSTDLTSNKPLLINLPAAAGLGSGGAIGFGYLGASALRALDLQLSAMEDTGKGKLVSNPRIITLDNEKATIKQGTSIPYPSVSEKGTETKWTDAVLELNVTPHVTPEGTIVMEVDIKKDAPDWSNAVLGQPAISTKNAKTKVLIMNGDTLVIGGIFLTEEADDVSSLPELGNIPVLGWLFKTQKKVKTSKELMIFITPSRVN